MILVIRVSQNISLDSLDGLSHCKHHCSDFTHGMFVCSLSHTITHFTLLVYCHTQIHHQKVVATPSGHLRCHLEAELLSQNAAVERLHCHLLLRVQVQRLHCTGWAQ